MEQAVQTASAHLPAPAPVGRRSPVSARPLPSTSQKAIENQEHRRGRTLDVYCFNWLTKHFPLALFSSKGFVLWVILANLNFIMFSLSNLTLKVGGGNGRSIWAWLWREGFFIFLFTNQGFQLFITSWFVDLYIFCSIAEAHKISRPENEQIRNENKRQAGKLFRTESHCHY